jgi:hypothetical protein
MRRMKLKDRPVVELTVDVKSILVEPLDEPVNNPAVEELVTPEVDNPETPVAVEALPALTHYNRNTAATWIAASTLAKSIAGVLLPLL